MGCTPAVGARMYTCSGEMGRMYTCSGGMGEMYTCSGGMGRMYTCSGGMGGMYTCSDALEKNKQGIMEASLSVLWQMLSL